MEIVGRFSDILLPLNVSWAVFLALLAASSPWRRDVASLYQENLKDLEQIILPPSPDSDPDHFDVYQNYEIEAKDRDKLKDYLAKKGIGTLIQWGGKGVHQWEALGFNKCLPKVEKFFNSCIMLPMNIFVSDEDIHFISDEIRRFYLD